MSPPWIHRGLIKSQVRKTMSFLFIYLFFFFFPLYIPFFFLPVSFGPPWFHLDLSIAPLPNVMFDVRMHGHMFCQTRLSSARLRKVPYSAMLGWLSGYGRRTTFCLELALYGSFLNLTSEGGFDKTCVHAHAHQK